MNERIKELAEQCGHYSDYEGWIFDKEKFAELIVRECASHLNSVGDEYACIELLEHFEVTE